MSEQQQSFTVNEIGPGANDALDPQTFPGSFATDLIHSMQDGFSLVDSNGMALEVNPALCRITGFSREELVGQFPPHPYWPPEEYPKIGAAYEETLNGAGSTFELTFMRKNGQRFPAIISAFTLVAHNGDPVRYAATVKDITERKQAEDAMRNWNHTLERRVAARTAELEQTQNRFRQLVDATFEGIVVSKNGIIIDVNHQIAVMLNYELSEIIGMSVLDCVAPESRSWVASRIVNGIEGPYEFLGMRKDGVTLPMEAHARTMDWKGKEMRVTAVRDLSAAKSAAEMLARQKAELDQALRLALVSEVSAGIIHQIAQPLCTIEAHVAGFTTRYQSEEVVPDDWKQFLAEIAANSARIRDSVVHLKALANPGQPKRQPVNFNEMVIEALKLAQATNGGQRFGLMAEMDGELLDFPVDRVQMSQVVINLVRNAMDASEDVPPERQIIRITTRAMKSGALELLIRDSGTGIPPSVKSQLFEPFFTTKPNGFGIGLRLAQTIVAAHGGTLEGFNNPDGVGATFRVQLPLIFMPHDTKV